MASTAQQINPNQSPQNNSCAKRKKSKGSKGSFLSKWLDKTLHHDSGSFPSLDADMYVNPNVNWHTGNSQFGPGYDNYRHDMYGCMPGHMSLPTFLNHCNPVIPPSDYRYVHSENKRVQRPRVRKTNRSKAEEISSAPIDSTNHSHYFQPKTMSDSLDYTSLPPIITSTGDTNSVSDVHTNERDEGNNGRRFSDPVVRGLPDVARPANGEVESESDSDSDLSGSQVGGRLLAYLLDQISSLKTANKRMNKELIETKAELETVRHQTFYPQAPNNFSSNGMLGGQYSPGFLADLVREIRDAARIREEAMYARVRAMVNERMDSGIVSAESKISDRTLEEIKCSLRASEADRRRMMDRIGTLEDELRTLRLTNGQEHIENRVSNGNDEDAECEVLRLRRELADTRKAKQSAEDNAHKLERLVTQMRSKFNGMQQNGPDSLPSDAEEPVRIRRISSSTNNSTGNLTNALNNSTSVNSTNALTSSNNLHNSSTNVLNSSTSFNNSSTNLLNTSNNLHNSSTNVLNSSTNIHTSSTNLLNSSNNIYNSSTNLLNSSTNLLNSSHNTNNSSFGHLTNASPKVFGMVTNL